jgi:DNA-binding MarR family transcriptional regulator
MIYVCRLSVKGYDLVVTDRRDLAAMVVPLGRDLLAAEQIVLDRHGVTMWGYIVLTALRDKPIRTQSALAEAIGADKTRIIPVLDDLAAALLIDRRPDPDDRRARLLELTERGRALQHEIQREIQHNERAWLDRLTPIQREHFIAALQTLSGSD